MTKCRRISRKFGLSSLQLLIALIATICFSSCANFKHPSSSIEQPGGRLLDTDAEMQAIRSRVAKLEAALLANDPVAYAQNYGVEASYINTDGPRVNGRSIIAPELAAEDPGPPPAEGISFQLSIAKIRFISPDVAVVDCDVSPSGSRATYVMSRQSGSWMVEAGRILQSQKGR